MNVFNEHPFKVLFDYGHNAHAVSAMADLAQRLDVTGRRIVVLAGPGDRRDEDLVAIANAVAGRFDHYICRRDDSLRDRAPDEVPRLQAAALKAAGVRDDAISVIPDEQQAVDAALRMGRAGDLLLIFADALVRSWKQVTKFRPDGARDEGSGLSVRGPQGMAGEGRQAAAMRPGHLPEPVDSDAGGGAASLPGHLAPPPTVDLEGIIRDERGVRIARETDD
jgi:cyanophycin synthetase